MFSTNNIPVRHCHSSCKSPHSFFDSQ